MDKPLILHVEFVIFKENRIQLYRYHGFGMDGPIIRHLMMNGTKFFDEIATFLKASLITDPSRVATDEEIEEVWSLYGELYRLFDYSFSFTCNIRHRKLPLVLKERLEFVCQKWLATGLSFTTEVHSFLDHVIDHIQEIKCYTTMGEDHIERAHQRRHRIES